MKIGPGFVRFILLVMVITTTMSGCCCRTPEETEVTFKPPCFKQVEAEISFFNTKEIVQYNIVDHNGE